MKCLSDFFTFTGKEFMELRRNGRLLIFLIVFVVLGVMNPATAKLTPWLLKTMADSLEATGITVTEYTVTAMDSWVQYFKNMPTIGLLFTVVMFGGFFTSEYTRGTLIPLLARGLSKNTVAAAKTLTMLLVWSGGYWMSASGNAAAVLRCVLFVVCDISRAGASERGRGLYCHASDRHGGNRSEIPSHLPDGQRGAAHRTGTALGLRDSRLCDSRRFGCSADGIASADSQKAGVMGEICQLFSRKNQLPG